jgi:nucleoid-associated protein YgaU
VESVEPVLAPYADASPNPLTDHASDNPSAHEPLLAFSTTSEPVPALLEGGVSLRDSGTYTVERGDSLWKITAQLLGAGASVDDISRAWPVLYEANRGVIGGNPSLIFSGQVLQVPASLA